MEAPLHRSRDPRRALQMITSIRMRRPHRAVQSYFGQCLAVEFDRRSAIKKPALATILIADSREAEICLGVFDRSRGAFTRIERDRWPSQTTRQKFFKE